MQQLPSSSILLQHEIFDALDVDHIQLLLSLTERRTYEEGELVFDTNMQPNYLFFIEEGRFSLHLPDNTFKEMEAGELFGEIGIINQDFRSGSVRAVESSIVSCISGDKLFNQEFVPAEVALVILRTLAKRLTTYLRSKEQISTEEIIRNGENDQVEFKSTLRWNLFANKKDPRLEHASLKTIAAFMNTHGGILLIGVADDGEILDLSNDQFPNHDKLLLHLTKLIKDKIGPTFTSYLHFSIEKINEKHLLRIDCQPAPKPAYLQDGQQGYFYIRTGPASTALPLSKVYGYIRERFYEE